VRKIALIGCMGSGKSTVASELGDAFDVDAEFERRHGGIPEFFATRGETAFREEEEKLLAEAAKSNARVIACGGGSVLSRRGMAALRAASDIVFIDTPKELCERRVRGSDRPLAKNFSCVYEERLPLYKRYADYTADGTKSAREIAAEIADAVKTPRGIRYDVVLCDADDTVLDFGRAMRFAISTAAAAMGVKADAARVIEEYGKILPVVWGRLERGEIDRTELSATRFSMLADALGEKFLPSECNDAYMRAIKTTRFVLDGALEFMDGVRRRGAKLYIITNSYKSVASERLKALYGHADGFFVSEDIGYDKPDRRFFERVHACIGSPDIARTIVFGDGVFPDMHGGAVFGADTCLFDPSGKKSTPDALYAVRGYSEFAEIL